MTLNDQHIEGWAIEVTIAGHLTLKYYKEDGSHDAAKPWCKFWDEAFTHYNHEMGNYSAEGRQAALARLNTRAKSDQDQPQMQ